MAASKARFTPRINVFTLMASSSTTSISLFLRCQNRTQPVYNHPIPPSQKAITGRRRRSVHRLWISATTAAQGEGGGGDGTSKRQKASPGMDTRIHWENDEEGWIGGSSKSSSAKEQLEAEEKSLLGDKFADLLKSTDSHYQFMGVAPNADLEEIKAAYRRLSKEYHPDTTSLPLTTASEKFMRLREIYDVLSNAESRRFYDWTLAQEAASRQAEKMNMKLEDPFVQDFENYESVPDMVDRLGGKNMQLSDQAMSALTFDIFIVLFSICCIIYVIFFKEQY